MKLDDLSQLRLLGWDDLWARGIKNSKPTIYRKIKAGKFPASGLPRQISSVA